jgi:hypothetical protein
MVIASLAHQLAERAFQPALWHQLSLAIIAVVDFAANIGLSRVQRAANAFTKAPTSCMLGAINELTSKHGGV